MDFNDVLQAVSAALDTDTDVQGYCQTTWTLPCTVFERLNPEAPPALENAPMVHLLPDNRTRQDMHHGEVLLLVAVFAPAGEAAQVAGTNIVRYGTAAGLEALAQRAEHCISRALHAVSVPFEQVPVDPEKLWGTAAFSVFYAYRVSMSDPLY